VELEAASKQLNTDIDGARATLKQSQDSVRSGLRQTRRALQALRVAPLEELGFTLAMRQLIEQAKERTGIKVTLDIAVGMDNLPDRIEQNIYRIAEEALNNTARHSKAQKVDVVFGRRGTEFELTVADDGIGFDPEAASPDERYGLVGMRERAVLCNGELSIESQPGSGTTVRLKCEIGD